LSGTRVNLNTSADEGIVELSYAYTPENLIIEPQRGGVWVSSDIQSMTFSLLPFALMYKFTRVPDNAWDGVWDGTVAPAGTRQRGLTTGQFFIGHSLGSSGTNYTNGGLTEYFGSPPNSANLTYHMSTVLPLGTVLSASFRYTGSSFTYAGSDWSANFDSRRPDSPLDGSWRSTIGQGAINTAYFRGGIWRSYMTFAAQNGTNLAVFGTYEVDIARTITVTYSFASLKDHPLIGKTFVFPLSWSPPNAFTIDTSPAGGETISFNRIVA